MNLLMTDNAIVINGRDHYPVATHYIRPGDWYSKEQPKPAPIGVLFAFSMHENEDRMYIGFSLCNHRDHFDKHKGVFIAAERAKFHFDTPFYMVIYKGNESYHWRFGRAQYIYVPETVFPHLVEFVNRLRVRYPDAAFPKWTQHIPCGELDRIPQEA